VLREGKVTNYELTARAWDGTETLVSYNASTLYDRNRKLQGVFAAARDITELKLFERALKEKNVELESAKVAAEAANLAKSEFLSSMSHELRSPLNAILGFAQLLESDTPPLTPDQHASVEQILAAGWHLLRLIDEILDLAKVESGQVPLSQEPVSLADVMRECRGMIEPDAQQRGIELVFPDEATQSFVRADLTRVKQVLINLLSNAVKYNREHGTVEVSITEVTQGRIRISVRDTGEGLPPEEIEQLFEAFNRLGQESGGEQGTGIGLVVAKRLVELMGGTIGVESTVGAGSVFWFELISAAEPHLLPEDDGVPAKVRRGTRERGRVHTLLYVEDNPANLKLVEEIVGRDPGIHLLTAVTGNSGVEIARESMPDAILMDINLPGINGFEALQILHADPATARIPVMALSANAMPGDIESGRRAGFFRYLTKPIKVNEFLDALDDVLSLADKEFGGAPSEREMEARPHTLLYIEDDPADLKLVEGIVSHDADMHLVTATTGNSGVEIARDVQPDAILMDINLPGINGFEALQLLRSDASTAHIPIVALSINTTPSDIESGLKAGFFAYVTKPIRVDELVDALRQVMLFADEESSLGHRVEPLP
jgi:signal transduction histidine kinase/CheY-like chemotaxis protein